MSKCLVVLFAFAVAGCGGSQQKDADDPSSGFLQPTAAPAAGSTGGSKEGSGEGGGLTEDQKKQMEIALRRGGEKAANCGETSGAEPGKGEVQVTFDGQKGRVTDVAVGSPWAGKDAESCIKRAFEKEIIVPFDGDPMEVPYTVEIVDKKKAGAKPGAKPGEKPAEKPAEKPKK